MLPFRSPMFSKVAGVADPFAINTAANRGFYGNATYPHAVYDSTGDKTWAGFEGWDGSQRTASVLLYDHANSRFEGPYLISTDTLTDNSHGPPALCIDHQGYVHAFYGSHNSAMKHSVSTSPRDASSWRQLDDIDTDTTYPKPVLVGSKIYLFYRGNANDSFYVRETTALNNGDAVFSEAQELFDFAPERFYAGNFIIVGTDVHFVATYAENDDSARRDIYHFIYDTTDGSLDNSTGGTSTATGSQPLSRASADANYRVINQTTNVTDIPSFCRTSDGDLHLCYLDGASAPFDLKYINFDGTSWSTPETVTQTSAQIPAIAGSKGQVCLLARADDSLELWFFDDDDSLWTVGGNMKRAIRSTGGTWGSEALIRTAGTNALINPTTPLGADEDLYVLFTETTQTDLDADAGDLKVYAYGSGGFVSIAAPVFASGPTIIGPDGFYGTGDELSISLSHTGAALSYQWKSEGSNISGATSPTYTLTVSEEGTTVTVEVTSTNAAGSTVATSAGVSAVAPSYSTETRTLSDASNRTTSAASNRTISNRTA